MNAPVTRRALLGATAAVGVIALPSVVQAMAGSSDLDAELFALLDRWREARAAWQATDAPYAEASARAKAAYPLRPAALWSAGDERYSLPAAATGRGMRPSGRIGSFYHPGDVEKLRTGAPVTRWAIADDVAQPPPREPDPEGEARRQEIIAVHDRWWAERKAVEEAVGYTAASDLAEALADAWNAVDDDLTAHQPKTVAGIVRKAAWVADCLSREMGREDLGEVFARQVAAFGGVVS